MSARVRLLGTAAQRLKVGAVTLAAAAMVAGVGGCFLPRRSSADAIGNAIRPMPGVSAADVQYSQSFTGGSHFKLDVSLADQVSDAQAAAVGRAFVDLMRAERFRDFEVGLILNYGRDPDGAPRSTAEFDYNFDIFSYGGPSSSEVADDVTRWLQVAQSPATAGVNEVRNASFGSSGFQEITVDLPLSVADAQISDLIRKHPELGSASWIVSSPTPEKPHEPCRYTVHGQFPSQRLRDIWGQIIEQLGPSDTAEGRSDTTKPEFGAPNFVGIWVYRSPESDEAQQVDRVARAVTPLLPGLGLPISLRLNSINFVIGGCDRPDHTPSALENELRRQYQHC